MSNCTDCFHYGKHLEGPQEDFPAPCNECAEGEKFTEPGSVKAKCPMCFKVVRVTKGGKFYSHNIGGWSNQRHRGFFKDKCPMSGKPVEKSDYTTGVDHGQD